LKKLELVLFTHQDFFLLPKLFGNTAWEYRDQLGKGPPLATMEFIWRPYAGDAHIIAGFVHPPTEAMS
jgi:anthranilate phosphoribosyltransferase